MAPSERSDPAAPADQASARRLHARPVAVAGALAVMALPPLLALLLAQIGATENAMTPSSVWAVAIASLVSFGCLLAMIRRLGLRGLLDTLYAVSAVLAALFLALIALIVLAQVACNLVDLLAKWTTGATVGLFIPSYAEIAGFFLAASTFFALAYTFRAGGHIRVSLVILRLTGRRRVATELWCMFIAGCLAAYFAWYMVLRLIESWEFADKSVGIIAVPIWIPQVPLVVGLIMLTVAIVDEYQAVLRGRSPTYAAGDDPMAE